MRTSQTANRAKDAKQKRVSLKEYLTSSKKRLLLVSIGLAVLLCLLIGRLIYICSSSGEAYEKRVYQQQNYSTTTLAYRRGTITDRNNTVLATSERRYTLILDPKVILGKTENDDGTYTYEDANIAATLKALKEVFGYDETEIREILDTREESSYVRYAKELTEDEKTAFDEYKSAYNNPSSEEKDAAKAQGIDRGKVLGVWFEQEYKRVYPFDSFACSLIGFSGSDSSRGNWGIEEYYNDELTGVDGCEYGYINSDGVVEREISEAQDGNTIVSTIDYSIQLAAENAIDDFLLTHDADNVAAIVMNPKNGEILALATDKTYDLNDPSNLTYEYTEEEIAALTTDEELSDARANMWHNFAVADAYEPGSTAKPFTVSAALENNVITADTTYDCTGSRSFGSGSSAVTVHCNDREGHGVLNTAQGLMYSCNCAMMDIAAKLGKESFSEFQTIFGFGRQTGIDLPGETAGLVYDADSMGTVDLATNSFGQNFNVNMIQQVSAFASLINGGNYYQPHVVKQILSSDGQVIKTIEPTLVRRTVSTSTSEFIKDALFETVENGTAKTAIISGYSVLGKTGTAEKQPREDHKYLVSFIGAAPADDPEILIYVIVDNPTVDYEIEDVSAKLAIAIEKNIMEAIIPYINLQASDASAIDTSSLGNIFDYEFTTADEVAMSNIEGEESEDADSSDDSDDDNGSSDSDNSDSGSNNDNNDSYDDDDEDNN